MLCLWSRRRCAAVSRSLAFINKAVRVSRPKVPNAKTIEHRPVLVTLTLPRDVARRGSELRRLPRRQLHPLHSAQSGEILSLYT